MNSAPRALRPLLMIMLLALVLAVVITESYQHLALWLAFSEWMAAAIVHTVLAVVIVLKFKIRPIFPQRLIYWLPSLVILLGSLTLIVLSRSLIPASPAKLHVIPNDYLYSVTWVALVEEICYRFGFSQISRSYLGPGVGGYVSALFFSMMHAGPSLANLLHGQLGVAIGPLLLGLIAETMVVQGSGLAPVVLLHAACNATPVLFLIFDDRWLKWLNMLYS